MIKQAADATEVVERAKTISRDVLKAHAGHVDRENRFPTESFDALRASGLLGLFVPAELGGIGGDSPTYCRIAHTLGRGCLSSALNYVMHVQQVVVMVDYAGAAHEDAIRAIARGETLIASVTSERGKGGDLSRAQAPIITKGDTITLKREAPIVSYAGQADGFLVLMRASETAPETDTRLVWVHKSDKAHAVKGGWNTMGMRGTQSVPIDFEAELPANRVLPKSFKEMGDRTLLPLGVLGFASVWAGAARGILDEVTHRTRLRGGAADPVLAQLARFRAQLDIVDSYILQLAERVDHARATPGDPGSAYWIALNSTKVAASETAFDVVNGLIQVVGLKEGFLQNDDLPIERVFRDLRSASLMHHNERLLAVSGRMMLMERLSMEEDAGTGPLA